MCGSNTLNKYQTKLHSSAMIAEIQKHCSVFKLSSLDDN